MSKSKAERAEDIYNELAPDWRGIPAQESLTDIAIVKGHEYANARAPNKARLYSDMKDAYKEGFLQGFAHRLGGGNENN